MQSEKQSAPLCFLIYPLGLLNNTLKHILKLLKLAYTTSFVYFFAVVHER